MFYEYYEISTHEKYWDGFVHCPIVKAYNKKQLVEALYEILKECKEAQKNYGHKIYALNIDHYYGIKLFNLIPIKDEHERVFHWDCYQK